MAPLRLAKELGSLAGSSIASSRRSNVKIDPDMDSPTENESGGRVRFRSVVKKRDSIHSALATARHEQMVSALMIRMPIGKSKILDPIRIRSATNASASVRDACGDEDDMPLDGIGTITVKQRAKKAMRGFQFPQDDSVLVRTVLFIVWVLAQFALVAAPYRVGFEDDSADEALGGVMVLVRASFFVDMVLLDDSKNTPAHIKPVHRARTMMKEATFSGDTP